MANRRPQNGGRRMDFGRNDRNKNFGRSGVSPWQGGGPGGGMPNLLPLAGGSTEATLALASNIINLLQPRQNPVPSLLDMPIRRDFGPNMGRYDRPFVPNRMGNQGNFRRTGNYNRAGERINTNHTNRKPFRPNDGPRQQNKSSPKKEADSKAKPVKESEQEEKKDGEEEAPQTETKEENKKDAPKTRYDDINPQLLKCHICNKSMWDGRSFENHLSGRAHAIMMQKTAESYALTADTMRQEFKIREMKRTRKSGQQPARDFYCAMCDMYAADGAVHRTNVGHRKLKKYLHPTCTSCHMEMPNRIELDEHRLTPEHLRNLQDKQGTISKPKPEVMVISTLSMEQSYLRDDRHRWRHGDHHDDRHRDANRDKDAQNEPEVKKEAEEPKEGEEAKPEESLDSETTILDYKEGDDLANITRDMYPAYSTERGVGASFLAPFSCVQCRLCRKLLDGDETAAVHLRTWRHHQLFLRLLGDKGKEKQSAEEESAQNAAGKRPADNEDDGNWKRRKTTGGGGADAQNGLDGATVKVEPGSEQDADGDADADAVVAGDGDADVAEGADAMPPADELEDWEQTVDEVLEDERDNATTEEDATLDTELEKTEENASATPAPPTPVTSTPATPTSVTSTPATPTSATALPTRGNNRSRATPRSRGRGRGRGRPRY